MLKPWHLSFIRSQINPHFQKESIPIKKNYVWTQTHPAFSSRWVHVKSIDRKGEKKRDIVQKAYARWLNKDEGGFIIVDWGIKCVVSVNFYLLIPLLFYGQSWIMLPSMNACGGGKKSMARSPHLCGQAFPYDVSSIFDAWLRWFTSWASWCHRHPSILSYKPPIFPLTEKWLQMVVWHLFLKPFMSSGRS